MKSQTTRTKEMEKCIVRVIQNWIHLSRMK